MALSGNDRKLRFTTSGVYTLPDPIKAPHNFAEGSINHVFGGWGLAGTMTAQTGNPISFGIPSSTVESSATITQQGLTASYAPGYELKDIAGHGPAKSRLSNYFNTIGVGNQPGTYNLPNATVSTTYCQTLPTGPSKLTCPQPTAFGNTGTDTSLRNPGQKTVDLALTKTTKIFEGYNIEFRGDFFNAFNWVNFGGPDAGITDETFGLIQSQTVEPRVIQISAKFKF